MQLEEVQDQQIGRPFAISTRGGRSERRRSWPPLHFERHAVFSKLVPQRLCNSAARKTRECPMPDLQSDIEAIELMIDKVRQIRTVPASRRATRTSAIWPYPMSSPSCKKLPTTCVRSSEASWRRSS